MESIKIEDDLFIMSKTQELKKISCLGGIAKRSSEKEERIQKHLNAEKQRKKLDTKMSEKINIKMHVRKKYFYVNSN